MAKRNKKNINEMTFLDHLEELRWLLVRSTSAVIIMAIVTYFFSDFIFEMAKQQYGKSVTKEDIFYYVYGFLHCKEYRETFANDLKKMLPRLPLVEDVRDFWKFSKGGRALAELHLNYETVSSFKDVNVSGKFVIAAFFGVALNMLAFFKGLQFTTPINGSVIMVTTPIIVLVLSVIILSQEIIFL